MIQMICPVCKMDIFKQEWQDVWECPYCHWRSDQEDGHQTARLTHLTDTFTFV